MRIVKVVALSVGIFLLFWIIKKIGVQELWEGIKTLGWRLLIPIIVIAPCYFAYTTAWQLFLKRFDHYTIPFWTLFRIKVAGEATNTLTPLNFAGGDPIRIWMLSHKFPVSIGGASVVVDRTLHILAVVTLMFLGNLAALFKLSLPLYAKQILGGTAFLLLTFMIFFIFHQRRGVFQKLIRLAEKLRIRKFSEETIKKIVELDQHIGDFYRQDRRLFWICFLLHLSGRLVGVLEIYILALFLDVPMGIWGAIFFGAVIPLTNLLGAIVPGTLGVLEGVVSSLFLALQWDPADGMVLQIARRLRALFWISTGIIFVMIFKGKNKKTNPPSPPPQQKLTR